MSRHTVLAIVLTLGYGASLALVLEPHVVPGLIKAAYRGESWAPFNGMLEGRSEYPLEHYMAKWDSLWRGVAVALIAAAAATLAARLAWGRSRRLILLAVLAPTLALIAVYLGPASSVDYSLHLQIWERTLAGGDPWAMDTPPVFLDGELQPGFAYNAYGPLFNLLAILASLDPLAPKVLYAVVWAAVIASLACRNGWIALAVAPLALWEATRGGRFDILVALCLLAALRDYLAGRDVAAGAWIGVGFLFKFLPLVVVPFLLIDGRRLRWRLATSALIVSAVGFALAIGIWGWAAPLRPLIFNAERPSGGAGLFAFVRYAMGFNLDRWSAPTMAVSLAALMVWSAARRLAPVPTALGALGLVLALHKFGSLVYPVMLAVPVAWYATERTDRTLQRATILYAGWASACIVIVISMRLAYPEFGKALLLAAGLPTCPIALALVAALLRRARAEARGQEKESASMPGEMILA